jgi:vancomycin resistance protein YoaR
MSFVVVPKPPRPVIGYQILAALLGGLLLFLAGVGSLSGLYQLLYAGRILPGVSMAGVELSNLTPDQASQTLEQRLIYPQAGQVVFRDGDRIWVAKPAELGLSFDTASSVKAAYQFGRRGGILAQLASQINSWQAGTNLAPVVLFDERVAYQYLQDLATQIDQPVVETELVLNGTEVLYTPGRTGRALDVDATLAKLVERLSSFQDGEVALVIQEQSPVVAEASSQAQILQQAVSAPLQLTLSNAQSGDPGPWTIDPAGVASMFTVNRVQTESGWEYQLSVDTRLVDDILREAAATIDQPASNARFTFDDNPGSNTRQLILLASAQEGRTLNIASSDAAITQALLSGQHQVPLAIETVTPEVGNNATAQSLGITGLVSKSTTFFRGSPPSRLTNIKTASSQFHGLLVPPNSTFSMGSVLGDISLDNGYAEALIIFNGRTITGVGGGVCQVSTTLFRTAFLGGYPIVERHAHAFRVMYYEQTSSSTDQNLAGLDATVYFPLVDLKFTNDRPYWLLMETYFNPEEMSLTWKFYSTDDGRTMSWQNLGLHNVSPAPAPSYVENPDFAPNTCKQVDYQADGADITVTRAVSAANGQELFSDVFQTHYEPWQAVYQIGPGTSDPSALVAEGRCAH